MELSCGCHEDVIWEPHTACIQEMQPHTMQTPAIRRDPLSGSASPCRADGAGYTSRLRDADWRVEVEPAGGGDRPARTQVLYRWGIPAGESAAGLMFMPLDGNPRNGVLGLFLTGKSEAHDAIEIVERQGFWMVMPDRTRARLLASSVPEGSHAGIVHRSSIAGTPDRRFVFFNTMRDGGTVALVERRQDGGAAPC